MKPSISVKMERPVATRMKIAHQLMVTGFSPTARMLVKSAVRAMDAVQTRAVAEVEAGNRVPRQFAGLFPEQVVGTKLHQGVVYLAFHDTAHGLAHFLDQFLRDQAPEIGVQQPLAEARHR